MTEPWQDGDSDRSRPGPLARAAAAMVTAMAVAGCTRPDPATPVGPPTSRAVTAAIDDGARQAHACEGLIDADFEPYVACIDALVGRATDDPARRAALRFQGWVMADLAVQQSATGAIAARGRWWRSLQSDLSVARLTLDEICALRGLDVVEIRRRMSRQTPAG